MLMTFRQPLWAGAQMHQSGERQSNQKKMSVATHVWEPWKNASFSCHLSTFYSFDHLTFLVARDSNITFESSYTMKVAIFASLPHDD
jgi:hypothetical protein